MPIASGSLDDDCVELQESDGIRRSIKASRCVQPKMKWPSHAPEGFRERGEACEAGGAAHWLYTLANGFRGIEDLKMNLMTMLIVGTEAKTYQTIVSHVEADLENTLPAPTWRAKCQWILCRKYPVPHEGPQRYRTHGGCMREIKRAMKHGDGRLDTPDSTPHDRERH
jgi:hypothetical protein